MFAEGNFTLQTTLFAEQILLEEQFLRKINSFSFSYYSYYEENPPFPSL
jgi:hypothetical protein